MATVLGAPEEPEECEVDGKEGEDLNLLTEVKEQRQANEESPEPTGCCGWSSCIFFVLSVALVIGLVLLISEARHFTSRFHGPKKLRVAPRSTTLPSAVAVSTSTVASSLSIAAAPGMTTVTTTLPLAPKALPSAKAARKDPRLIPNATMGTVPWIVHRFAGRRSPHICMQCLMIPRVSPGNMMDVLQLQLQYARMHGYDLYTFVDEEDRKTTGKSPLWYKIRSTQYLIDSGTTGCDYIFWMDSDAVIMNMSFKLESLIHWNGLPDTDVVVAADTLAVNLAQSFWKFTKFSRDLLEDMWNVGEINLMETGSINVLLGGCKPQDNSVQKKKCYDIMDRGWREPVYASEVFFPGDNAKIAELVVNKSLLPHFKWVPKRTMNSYPLGLFRGQFQVDDGDFIVHCPSRRGKQVLRFYIDLAMMNAGLLKDPSAEGKADPSSIPNATRDTRPWVIYRFAGKKSPRFCLHASSGDKKPDQLDALTLQVEYARRHGYDLYQVTGDRSGTPVEYHDSISWLMDSGTTGCDYLFWMSPMAVVMNMDFRLESLIHWDGTEDADLVVAGTRGEAVRLAAVLWKFSKFNRRLISDMRQMGNLMKPGGDKLSAALNAMLGGCQPADSYASKLKCRDSIAARKDVYAMVARGNTTALRDLAVNRSLAEHLKWVPKRLIYAQPVAVGFPDGEHEFGDKDFLVHCEGRWGAVAMRRYLEPSLVNFGLKKPAFDPNAAARKDPSIIPNATFSSQPWVVHRFAKPGVSPHMCMQCLMIPKVKEGPLMDVLHLQVEYARRHGYDLYTFVDESDRKKTDKSPLWYKLRSTQYLIDSGTTGCDYIFWMDSDAVIMNMSFKLESLIHWNGLPDTDVVVAADTLAVNLAQSLWKFTRFSRDLLEDMWHVGTVPLMETGSINALLGGCTPEDSREEKKKCYDIMDRGWRDEAYAKEVFVPGDNAKIAELVVNKSLLPHIKWVPKRTINSYPNGYFRGQYTMGDPDFIVHCPSRKGKQMLPTFIKAGLSNAGLR